MPVKIYWGPPGSYKTSACIWEEVARCAREGRHLITNIRGMDLALIREHCPDVHPKFTMEVLRTDDAEDIEKLRRWWHWAPPGAYIVLDEVQEVYKPRWTNKQLQLLDAPQMRVINGNGLPVDLEGAFMMHRHGNWDLAFCTPSIKLVIPEIRAAAEGAYKHRNLAFIGLRGRFLQCQHAAEDNGNASDFYSKRIRRIPAWVFRCYQSTATGAVSDSKVGLSLLANPRVLFLVGVLAFVAIWIGSRGVPKPFVGSGHNSGEVASTSQRPTFGPDYGVVGPSFAAGPHRPIRASQMPQAGAYRIIGTVQGVRQSYAILTDGVTTKRVDLSGCYQSNLDGWRCGDAQPSAWGSYDVPELKAQPTPGKLLMSGVGDAAG